jgi:fibronectin type 3 domain-containing protein
METEDLALTQFKDIETEPNTRYSYTITSVNTAGVESRPSPMLVVTTPKTLLNPKIKAFYAEVDRENKYIQLSWRYNEPDVLEIQVYRKEAEGNFLRYGTIEPIARNFVDDKVVPNTQYSYGLQIIFKDGGVSEWSELNITY